MIALAACIRDHWHAVERDLLALNFTADDIGSKLSLCQLVSIVMASPTGSSVHTYDPMRWSKTDELIANLGEQQAGLVSLNARYPRPQVDSIPGKVRTPMDAMPAYGGLEFDSAPADEFTAKLKERQRKAREEAK